MLVQRPERARERSAQPPAKLGTHADSAQSLGQQSRESELNRFVQGNTEHDIQRFEMSLMFLENEGFFFRQTRPPVLLDRLSAGYRRAAVAVHDGPPRAEVHMVATRISVPTRH